MSKILDAQGRPTRPTLTDEDIIQAFNAMMQRIQIQGNQITHMGLIMEFTVNKLKENGIQFSDEEFAEFAQSRIKEVHSETKQILDEAKQEMEDVATPIIRLDDDE
jgi:hypothetical protein